MNHVSILLCLFVVAVATMTISISHAFYDMDLHLSENKQNNIVFSSGIFDIPIEATQQTTLKRVLIFGNDNTYVSTIGTSMYSTTSSNGFFSVSLVPEHQIPFLRSQNYFVIEDFQLEFNETPIDASRIGEITGSNVTESKYGYTGKDIVIAIVDTGVDFSNPDIRNSLARDDKNHPIMLDSDGQGIILTNATFFAYIDKNNVIRNYTQPLPEDITSSVYRTRDGVFLDIAQDGKGTDIQIYNSFFPLAGAGPVFNGTLTEDMKIGKSHQDYIVSKSGIYHLGIMYQGALQGSYARLQVVPVLVTDPNIAGVYDTIIPDMSTSWEDYTRFDLENQSPDYDFDFTDEKPIVLGSGNEFLVYDSNNDGVDDYSAGTIGAYVLDVYEVMQNKTTTIEDNVRAVNGTLLPPLDPDGNYFGVMTDFQGHGTSSAASIVSKGIQEYDIYNDTNKFSIKGVAPDATILPVKSLWFGDAVYAWLWAAGFDNDDVNWTFQGNPRADIISNSWGCF